MQKRDDACLLCTLNQRVLVCVSACVSVWECCVYVKSMLDSVAFYTCMHCTRACWADKDVSYFVFVVDFVTYCGCMERRGECGKRRISVDIYMVPSEKRGVWLRVCMLCTLQNV